MALNPACTPGKAVRDPVEVRAFCGCGWEKGGFPSKRKALAAQREHRFPGPNPREAGARPSSSVRPTPTARPIRPER